MRPFEIILSVKVRADDVTAARAIAVKLAKGFSDKGMPSEWQGVHAIREEEMKVKK